MKNAGLQSRFGLTIGRLIWLRAMGALIRSGYAASFRMLPGQMVDGRIAFLKTELKIAPAQVTQWQQVATAMRENANALGQAINTARQQRGTMDAVQRLTMREQFAKVRAENDARLLTAFKPLYASLSPEQQQIANELVGAHHYHGLHHRA